jgi:geranylgeranyl diphosphate synthase type II
LKALEFSDEADKLQLERLYSVNPSDPSDKIDTVKQLFLSSGSAEATKKEIENYTNKAFSVLESLKISKENKNALKTFGNDLMNRNA